MSPLSRRHCLLGIAGCCLSVRAARPLALTPRPPALSPEPPALFPRPPARTLADALAGAVLDADAAAALGRRFLAARPALPRDPLALGRLILPDPGPRRAFIRSASPGRRRLLRLRIAADFTAGRTVDVDGWVLAETEALLAGLIAARRTAAVDRSGDPP